MTFTKDKAKELRNAFECWQQDYDPVDDKEQYDMFGSGMDAMDALLASLEAEPVYQFWNVKTHEWVECDKATYDSFTHSQRRVLYTAPPAPVVPAGYRLQPISEYDAMCAAMLQGAEPVSQREELTDGFDFDRFNDLVWLEAVASNPQMHSPTTSTIAMVALELNRKLAAGNSPVIPDGWVACSERMPETAGNYWGWWSESKRQGPVWFIKSELQAQFQSSEITHWMPLPAAPQQEA